MHTSHFSLRALAVTALLGAATFGCDSSDDRSAASDADYDDVAQALGAVTASGNQGGEIDALSDAASIARGIPRLGLALDLEGHFAGTRGALMYSYDAECRDANDSVLLVCGPTASTASVNIACSGDLVTPHIDASLEHSASVTVSNLQDDAASITGDGSFDFDAIFVSHFANTQRDYHLSYDVTYDAVLISSAGVIGGRAHYVVSAERMVTGEARTSEATFEMDATLVFNDAGNATLTLDGSHTYTIDTRTGAVSR